MLKYFKKTIKKCNIAFQKKSLSERIILEY